MAHCDVDQGSPMLRVPMIPQLGCERDCVNSRSTVMFPVGYIRRHWRGQLSLPVSYWVNGPVLWVGLLVAAFAGGVAVDVYAPGRQALSEIGRASCRERV